MARLEAGRPPESAVNEAEVAQDSAQPQFVNQGAEGPPAHWLEVVRRHAPHLLHPLPGQQRGAVLGLPTALHQHNEGGAASEPNQYLKPGRQPTPPTAGEKTVPVRRVHQSAAAPEPGIKIKTSSRKKYSVMAGIAAPQISTRRDRHSSADEIAAHAPRKDPVVCPTLRPLLPSPGASAPLAPRSLFRPAGDGAPRSSPCPKVHDFSRVPTATLRGYNRPERQARQPQAQSTRRPDGAPMVEQIVAPVREAAQVEAQVEAQALPRSGRTGTGEVIDHLLPIEPEWPRLPDETDESFQSTRTGAKRWPSLLEYAWDPGARLSPSKALKVANQERRNALRLQRRDLEQRGELWNA